MTLLVQDLETMKDKYELNGAQSSQVKQIN